VLLLLGGSFFTVGIDPYIRRKQKRIMLILLATVSSLVAQNHAEYLLQVSFRNVMLRRVVASCGYIVRPLILLLFIYVVLCRPS